MRLASAGCPDQYDTRERDAEAAYQPWIPPKRGFYVYRAWDSDGRSIYVGMVGFKGPALLTERLRHHEMTAEWWPQVARVDWAELGSMREALAEETRQIAEVVPVYNKKRPKPGGTSAPARPQVSRSQPTPPLSVPERAEPSRKITWSWCNSAPWAYLRVGNGESHHNVPGNPAHFPELWAMITKYNLAGEANPPDAEAMDAAEKEIRDLCPKLMLAAHEAASRRNVA